MNEFLAEQHHFQNAPTTFQMGALLQEMQQIEGAREQLIQGPCIVCLLIRLFSFSVVSVLPEQLHFKHLKELLKILLGKLVTSPNWRSAQR